MAHPSFYRGAVAGVTIGAVLAFSFCAIQEYEIFYRLRSEVSSILTAFVAIISAFYAYSGIARQIKNTEEVEERRRLARLEAERAALPIALSNLGNSAENTIKALAFDKGVPENISILKNSNRLQSSIDTIKSCIEHDRNNEALIGIIRNFQMCVSRTDRLSADANKTIPDHKYELNVKLILDWLLLRELIGDCFEYARGEGALPMQFRAKSLDSQLAIMGLGSQSDLLEAAQLHQGAGAVFSSSSVILT
ncbi:hypothetical protein [Anianabacter salinae]|uniref:hypothetical protein n=1 Tax=Anianabacter salinae TaxID=2851023 RepID=UPI00225DD482|nr:hypothetical protein [Anianabacter salinae]MBV0912649.1 hypothetical protein [Anianabacter salinae]